MIHLLLQKNLIYRGSEVSMKLKGLKIGEKISKYPIIQGGMGVGISGYKLAGNVAKERRNWYNIYS